MALPSHAGSKCCKHITKHVYDDSSPGWARTMPHSGSAALDPDPALASTGKFVPAVCGHGKGGQFRGRDGAFLARERATPGPEPSLLGPTALHRLP